VLEEDGDTAALLDALTGAENVVYAPSMPSARLDIAAGYRLFNAVRRLVASLAGMTSPPRLHVVTRNAQPIDEGDRANPAHAVLWGLGRKLALEHPEFWGRIIDVDDSVPPELIAHYVQAEVRTADGEDQVVYQGGVRRVPRLERRTAPAVSLTRLEGDTSHLVIGATGNVGPHLIRQLAEMGAATIVAVSRRGGPQLEELASELTSGGTKLIEVAADAADEAAMTALFGRFGKDLPPLDGIYLAALAGGEVLVSDMTDDDVNTMFRSKLDVASVLHRLSLKTPVRRFVVFSSITGILGSRWLGHYTAAGAFLDTFAYARRALGLAATVVDWGLWKSWADAQPATTAAGLQPMPNEVAIRMLPTVLSPDGGVQSAVVAADWSRLAEAYRMRGSLRVVDHLLTDDGVDAPSVDHVVAPAPGTLLGGQVATTAPAHLWQARLLPDAKPYPGGHRVRGVEVVPVSVLLQTLSAAAAQRGASTLCDIRFEYPIVVDQQRVIHVVADGESITVSSSPGADTPAQRWIRHVSARISERLSDDDSEGRDTSGDHDMPGYDGSSVDELQRAWGIEGQPFGWSVGSCGSAPGGLHAEVCLPEASTVALLDAAVHVARLADSSNPRLMLPAAVESVRFAAELADAQGSVEVRRRGGNGDELVVDIAVKAPDGGTCVDIRGLRYAAVESGPVQAAPETHSASPETPAWSQMPSEDMLSELKIRLRAILAHELGMPASAVDTDQPFPELGLDSMMAMNLLREAKQLVRIDLSATMLWNHPTISSLAAYLAEMLAPQEEPKDDDVDLAHDSASSVLDALFDSVESVPAGSESGI
jgi:NAD(P)-dependent dehydrogenase (short-subunit alcohol dehydrogenase family)/acyl carrier protein